MVEEEIIVDRDLQDNENCTLVGSRNCLNFVNTSEFSEVAIRGVEQKRCCYIFTKFAGKPLRRSLSLIKLEGCSMKLYKNRDSNTDIFFWIFFFSFRIFHGRGLVGQSSSATITLIGQRVAVVFKAKSNIQVLKWKSSSFSFNFNMIYLFIYISFTEFWQISKCKSSHKY